LFRDVRDRKSKPLHRLHDAELAVPLQPSRQTCVLYTGFCCQAADRRLAVQV